MQRKLCTCWVFTRDDFAAKFIEDRPQQWGSGSCAVGVVRRGHGWCSFRHESSISNAVSSLVMSGTC